MDDKKKKKAHRPDAGGHSTKPPFIAPNSSIKGPGKYGPYLGGLKPGIIPPGNNTSQSNLVGEILGGPVRSSRKR